MHAKFEHLWEQCIKREWKS